MGIAKFPYQAFFSLQTNKCGGQHTVRSHLIPIAQMFQRRIMWMSGLADRFLDALEKNDAVDKESKCETDDDRVEEELIHNF